MKVSQVAAFVWFAGGLLAQPVEKAVKPDQSFDKSVQPFLVKNCLMCHNAKMASGELDLQKHSQPDQRLKDRHVWESVVVKLRSGEMPPKGLPRPKQEDIAAVTGWIQGEYDRIDTRTAPDPGRVTARRLNRYEYNNTVRDLTRVSFRPADEFPADDAGYGFDNIGDVLSLSPVLMEKYMTAAEKIARRAIVAEPFHIKPTRVLLKAETAGMGEHLKVAPLSPGAIGPMPSKTSLHLRHTFPVEGTYQIKIALGGLRPDGTPPLTMAFWVDDSLKQQFEVDPQRGKKRAFELTVPISPGSHTLSAAILNDTFDPAEHPVGVRDRQLAIDTYEITGPFDAVVPPLPESHKYLISCGHALNQHQPGCARKVVTQIARRGFRRMPTEKEIARLVSFVEAAQTEGDSFEQGVRIALQAVLVSPQFLFRIERDKDPLDGTADVPISEFELASRLSYFLWSSMPDERLLDVAGRTSSADRRSESGSNAMLPTQRPTL